MILEMDKGRVKVVQNSCEKTGEALIYLRFKDLVLSNKDKITFLINDVPLEQVKHNVWKINHSIHNGTEDKLVVIVKRNEYATIYEGVSIVKNYFSFGELGEFKLPQVILDLNERISQLEKRIKTIESKSTVI
jgi:hypothetical protein